MRTNPKEEEIIKALLEVIDNVCYSTSYNIESETTLDPDDDEEFSDFEDDSTTYETEDADPFYGDDTESQKPPIESNFSLDFMKKVIDYYDAPDSNGKIKHIWGPTQNRFRFVPHRQYIARFRHYIEQDGTKQEKMKIIDDFVYEKFEEARDAALSIHDRDLKRWTLQKAVADSIPMFEASEYWLRVFKHRHRICSRSLN